MYIDEYRLRSLKDIHTLLTSLFSWGEAIFKLSNVVWEFMDIESN
jgi:hypothetical protein